MKRFQPGLFYEYEAKSTHKKEIPKPTWLEKSYLPNYEKACAFNPPTFEDGSLWQSSYETLVFDIETYPNYFLIAFKSVDSGRCIYFEKTESQALDIASVKWILENYRVVSFNGNKFDIPIISLALHGASLKVINEAVREIIVLGMRGHEVVRNRKAKVLKPNHIDLIEVCPLSGSLKIYGARLHTKQLADLPFPVDANLSPEQQIILRWYCFNDLQCTEDIFNFLKKDLDLRESMGEQYGVDLRSKSDAQIAEAVISTELYKLTGERPKKEELPSFYGFTFQPPSYLNFQYESLQQLLLLLKEINFSISPSGHPQFPPDLRDIGAKYDALKIILTEKKDKHSMGETTKSFSIQFYINGCLYTFGMGGLHSNEANIAQFSDSEYVLIDRDVASYYPFIILNNQLYPEHLGPEFLTVYRTIVERRLKAKKEKDKRTADSLKITINGSFGKFGNSYSILYSPKLLIQTTLTGQLSLLYLIEKIELAGIKIVSGNTDGIVIKCPVNRQAELNAIVKECERVMDFETEETRYHCLASRSVNDYMALKTDLECKGKGKLGWGITKLFKNPDKGICIKAIENLLAKSIPIETTINECTDIRDFIIVRVVKGGGVKKDEFLGKVVRYYYSTEDDLPIVYAKTGNKVPDSDGAKPCMELPDELPRDVDFTHYIRLTKKLLDEMGLKY